MASNYPSAIDSAATLYSPVDAFSTKPLETTAAQQILAGDTTISVASTDGFAASYGILSIDDELIVYTAKNATQFTGCQRGVFGTTASQHAQGATVRANMVAAFITALQSAVLAIENELGTAAAWKFVRAIGDQIVTGLKTFQDGAAFGSGSKAATGLVRLPNGGAVRWRKADDSGDLGLALGANDHLVADAIIDFAPGQTFGAPSYPDATTTSKGIVQIDPVGGIAVNAGVIGLANSGVSPGTYPNVTVDAKGRVTSGQQLSGSDLPAHQHALADLPSELQQSGPYQTIGGAFENMAKFSEDFAASVWDRNGGSCSVTPNSVIAPDGNQIADVITAVTDTPVIQQQIAGLADGGIYTFYIWARVPSGTRKVSLAIVNNAYTEYLAGPTQITLTTSWQRFKITGTLAAGQTGLWIVVRQYAANGDDWTTGDIHLWGACLQQGNDSKKGYARTWASQTPHVNAGLATGPTVIAAPGNTTSPLKIHGPGSSLADSTLLELTANGELILAGGSGNGYRLAELMGATNPSGWAGVIKVKTPAGTTLGYILLYANP
ncbi:MAG TPA: hypothetical protein PLA43_19690 [Bryobacteraceae bacterium]|nr:hypothetical protein [Bryobacteraceae bacterium]